MPREAEQGASGTCDPHHKPSVWLRHAFQQCSLHLNGRVGKRAEVLALPWGHGHLQKKSLSALSKASALQREGAGSHTAHCHPHRSCVSPNQKGRPQGQSRAASSGAEAAGKEQHDHGALDRVPENSKGLCTRMGELLGRGAASWSGAAAELQCHGGGRWSTLTKRSWARAAPWCASSVLATEQELSTVGQT